MNGHWKRVLCIGAGPSGLAALEQLDAFSLQATCYESREGPGGVWRHSPDAEPLSIDFDKHGRVVAVTDSEKEHGWLPSSAMYDALRTNLPHPLMSFRGNLFQQDIALYPGHADVTEYLEKMASRYSDRIKCRTKVMRVSLVQKKPDLWRAVSQNLDTLETTEEYFDFVIAANGHYHVPYIPPVDGLRTFSGRVQHSRTYRRPSDFEGLNVLVVGGMPSGYDITRAIAKYHYDQNSLARVYQSVRDRSRMFSEVQGPEALKVTLLPGLSRIEGKAIHFVDGTFVDTVDVILFATGYQHSFPFFSADEKPFKTFPLTRPEIVSKDTAQAGTAKHPDSGLVVHHLDSLNLFYHPHPSLAFLALHYKVVPFPFSQVQSRLVAAKWSGSADVTLSPGPDFGGDGLASDEVLKASLTLGSRQFDKEDEMMRLIGEGQEGEAEVTEDGRFGAVSAWRRGLRASGNVLKRASLGY